MKKSTLEINVQKYGNQYLNNLNYDYPNNL